MTGLVLSTPARSVAAACCPFNTLDTLLVKKLRILRSGFAEPPRHRLSFGKSARCLSEAYRVRSATECRSSLRIIFVDGFSRLYAEIQSYCHFLAGFSLRQKFSTSRSRGVKFPLAGLSISSGFKYPSTTICVTWLVKKVRWLCTASMAITRYSAGIRFQKKCRALPPLGFHAQVR